MVGRSEEHEAGGDGFAPPVATGHDPVGGGSYFRI